MAAAQKEISVSEFFAKNRHLLGFDNPRKALLTTVKEAVDNSLDACEEAGILPNIWVKVTRVAENRFRVSVQDCGPGIVPKQIPLIYGKLLYGSKFHRLRMSRGQQGIGISAAGMYGLLTIIRKHNPTLKSSLEGKLEIWKALEKYKNGGSLTDVISKDSSNVRKGILEELLENKNANFYFIESKEEEGFILRMREISRLTPAIMFQLAQGIDNKLTKEELSSNDLRQLD
ncbi:MAG: hypothetical protein II561_02530, partial [Thermoguttaceae bacterium]|nr:hypothetical protein [Thermoguttaceae bacterium]